MNAWEFVDALLEEAEQENRSCSFSPAQVTKLREMIDDVTTPNVNGRRRTRAARGQNLSNTRAIKMPIETLEQLERRAAKLNISFNVMLTHACDVYLQKVDDFVAEYNRKDDNEDLA